MKEIKDLVDAYADSFVGYGSSDARIALMAEIEKQGEALADAQKKLKVATKTLRNLSKWADPVLVDVCKSALSAISGKANI